MKRQTFTSSDVGKASVNGKQEPAARVESGDEDADDTLVADFREKLLEEIDLAELSKLDLTQRRARLERVMTHLVASRGPLLSSRERTSLIRRVVDEALGLGVLEPLLADAAITEIMINGHDHIYIERFGRIERAKDRFVSTEQLLQTIDRIVSTVNRRVDESSPMVDARLPHRRARERHHAAAGRSTARSSRSGKFPRPYTIDRARLGRHARRDHGRPAAAPACGPSSTCSSPAAPASGKTTLLNALVGVHPRTTSASSRSRTRPSCRCSRTTSSGSKPARRTSRAVAQVTIRDLVRNALRMRPDRIIVGEVRGGEALDMLQAMNTGHEGSLTTVHANSPDEALSRVETLASMSELELPFAAVREQVNNAIDIIIQLNRGPDGSRRIVGVTQLVSKGRQEYELHR